MSSPQALLRVWNLRAKKPLGQHFLADPSTAEMIVRRAGIGSQDLVLEIGAGLGALTLPLARAAQKVFAVEKDTQLVGLLNSELTVGGISNVTIINSDILKLDLQTLDRPSDRRFTVMGNLPYNVSSQVMVQLIRNRAIVSKAVFMLQKELAERVCANPGKKDYGRLTAMLRYCADIRPMAEVKAGLFFPKPKVDSAVIEIRFHNRRDCSPEAEAHLFAVIKAAFSQRRKTLKNALAGSEMQVPPKQAVTALLQAGIDPRRRAETLAVEEFVRLSEYLQSGETIP